MSSILSTGNAPAQRVPAWKRLGLKLKQPASSEAGEAQASNKRSSPALPTTNTAASPAPNHHRQNPFSYTSTGPVNSKRKASGVVVPALDHSAKKARRDNGSEGQNLPPPSQTQTPKRAKSVSFAAGTAAESQATATGTPAAKKPKQNLSKKAAPAVPAKAVKQAPVNLEPALAYLRQWHASKDAWKFNKNHQTRLLEQVFTEETTIPAADIDVFYEYIRGLKGAVRTRFRELATGVRVRDMELGAGGFSGSKDAVEKKQKDYEGVVTALLSQERTPEKRRFEEVDYVLRTADMEMRCRVVKRMRAEMVLDELSDSETTETASTTTTTTTSTEKGVDGEAAGQSTADGAEGDITRLRLNDDPQQRVKRRRKTRTAVVEDETSSESDSESDSDSDSDSSESSSSSSEDSDDDGNEQVNGEVSSSSSSSSESSDSDSDSEDDD
ncbi:hypothetical protein F5B20DRAFT_60741 [Whalleya microplaca]|nr:hypothetical protein F5B20DRAFT_60741 [Whalleya microplaca]